MNAKRMLLTLALIAVLTVGIVGGWTFYAAWDAGVLPWQPEPTRVVVTPFADLPTPFSTPGN